MGAKGVIAWDEDNLRYCFTDTALLRRFAAPVFLPPWCWSQTVWRHCK